MEQNTKIRIIILIALSVLCVLMPTIYTLMKTKVFQRRKKSEIGTLLIISASLVASIFLLRLSLGIFNIAEAQMESEFIVFFNSIFETLRTFAIEEDYLSYIDALKKMTGSIVSEDNLYFNAAQKALVAYATALNTAAPIAGGAIIFEILASIFPKIKMEWCYVKIWRKKYFFSELNEASIALAKGILSMRKSFFKKPVLVFTDAYLDDEDETKSELFLEAKSLGAICIKDDISHVKKNWFGSRAFLLIDEDESANLRVLTDLCDKYNAHYLKKSEIFFVTDSDAYLEIERRIQDKLINDFKFKVPEEEEKKDGKKCKKKKDVDEVPTFIPIKSYRNLISNLLVDIPLFEPLLDRKDKSELNVTILGTGHIGTEMFLTTYWMGQILDCKLNINVVSEESENAFWNKIDYVNPEIKRTTEKYDPILVYNRKGEKSDPYCNVRYICCDAKSSCFVDCINEAKTDNILDTDYYFVSLGDDDLNISVANTIKNAVGKYHISRKDDKKAVIAYVVYDPNVSEVLNRKNLYSFAGKTADILMRAVGNLEEIYSADNIFLMKYDQAALKMHNDYLKAQGKEVEEVSSNGERKDKKIRTEIHKKRMKDDYKYWANLSRSMHIKYKMFSMGILYDSAFNFESLDDEKYKDAVNVSVDKYKRTASGKIGFDDPKEAKKYEELSHRLAWLEHRRWNAFTRVKGFRHTADYDVYAKAGDIGSYKQMELKLHPCLVECDEKGIRKDAKGNCLTLGATKAEDFDLLDELSFDLHKKRYNDYDFKKYDYPAEDSN